MYGIIYKATSSSGKVYIGQTVKTLSAETREKMSVARLTENLSIETRKKISDANKGVGNGRSKLTESAVIEIKRKLLCPICNISYIAKEYAVSRRAIYQIKNGFNWGWLSAM